MSKAKKRISSGTKILKALTKNDKMKSVELRQIAFNNKTSASHYNGKVKKVPQGWWCVGISNLRWGGMIEQDENGLYSITELGRLNIDKPFTKNPTMPKEVYTKEINRLTNDYIDSVHTKRNLLYDLEQEQESNGELLQKNCELLSEIETLKSQLDEYQKTEEIGFLLGLEENDADSYGQDVIKRIVGRLKK
tara:strand:+ start:2107 stop:2682 length:576 start_codon:yes stop_codon:yes gene_type:complete